MTFKEWFEKYYPNESQETLRKMSHTWAASACAFARAKAETKEARFKDLSLGAKFNYPSEEKIWVKIGATTIAEWDEGLKTSRWLGQSICSFDENDDTGKTVSVL